MMTGGVRSDGGIRSSNVRRDGGSMVVSVVMDDDNDIDHGMLLDSVRSKTPAARAAGVFTQRHGPNGKHGARESPNRCATDAPYGVPQVPRRAAPQRDRHS